MATAILTSIKACVPEFKPEELSDTGKNVDRRWKEWLENLELVLGFEGVTDPAEGASKRRTNPQGDFFHPYSRGGYLQGRKGRSHSTLLTKKEFDSGSIPIFLQQAHITRGNS